MLTRIWLGRGEGSADFLSVAVRAAIPTLAFLLVVNPHAYGSFANQQRNSPVQFQAPVHVASVSGTVTSSDDRFNGIDGVSVEECNAEFKNCVVLTVTDESGKFSCPEIDAGTHFLLFQKTGFIPLGTPVTIDRRSRGGLQVQLDPST
jgi:hypothetical protein